MTVTLTGAIVHGINVETVVVETLSLLSCYCSQLPMQQFQYFLIIILLS